VAEAQERALRHLKMPLVHYAWKKWMVVIVVLDLVHVVIKYAGSVGIGSGRRAMKGVLLVEEFILMKMWNFSLKVLPNQTRSQLLQLITPPPPPPPPRTHR
jgi:hypothetical protein